MNDSFKYIISSKRQLWRKGILFWIFTNISIFVALAQQEPQFSQNNFNQLTTNPGFAGSSGLINVSILNRFQWVGFPGAPVTTVFNADAAIPIIGKLDGIGLSVINDVIGFEKNVSVGLNYAWRKELDYGILGSGISLGLMNKNLNFNMSGIDGSDLINSSDPALPQGKAGGVVTDIGLGLYYQTANYDISFSGRHLNRPVMSFGQSGKYTLQRVFYLSGSYSYQMADERLEAIPSIFYKRDAAAWQADLSISFLYDKKMWGGFGYRIGDAVIISLGTELWNGIKFGYSYDVNISALSKYNSGSHEFFLSYSVLLYKKHSHKYKSVRFL